MRFTHCGSKLPSSPLSTRIVCVSSLPIRKDLAGAVAAGGCRPLRALPSSLRANRPQEADHRPPAQREAAAVSAADAALFLVIAATARQQASTACRNEAHDAKGNLFHRYKVFQNHFPAQKYTMRSASAIPKNRDFPAAAGRRVSPASPLPGISWPPGRRWGSGPSALEHAREVLRILETQLVGHLADRPRRIEHELLGHAEQLELDVPWAVRPVSFFTRSPK